MFIVDENKAILTEFTTKQIRQYGKIEVVKTLKLLMSWRNPLNLTPKELKSETKP